MRIAKGMKRRTLAFCAGLTLAVGLAPSAVAQPANASVSALTYADLADLADPAQLVLQVKVSRQAVVEPARAPGLAPGYVRLFVVAKPESTLTGQAPVTKTVQYLVDVPVGAGRKVPRIQGQRFLIFARAVRGTRPEDVQLVAPDAQIPADPATIARLAPLLSELADAGGPPRITGVRDVLSVSGNLVGESETQLFLESSSGPVLVSVVHRPEVAPVWSVSWSELVDQAGRPPAADTLAWYRLACGLPERLPPGANLASNATDRSRATRDYALIKQELGACPRTRNGNAPPA